MNKNKLREYIFENFTLEGSSAKSLLNNILEWVSLQSMDREDTVSTLLSLLDGLGITKEEIEMFVEGGLLYEDEKVVATYAFSNTAGVAILDANDEQVVYRNAFGKKRHSKVYYTASGRAYFLYAGASRIYLDECMRI